MEARSIGIDCVALSCGILREDTSRAVLSAPASLLLTNMSQAKTPKVLQTFYNGETNIGQLGETFDRKPVLSGVSGELTER